MRRAEEFAFDIAGVRIAGKRWRNGQRPLLALHGWLDNAASYDRLAPLLDGADVVALDLAGHGLSYHRTAQGSYNIWDDLPDIVRVADHLGWERFHLIGHSRGAMIAVLLTAALPERVDSLALLDGFTPQSVPVAETFDQLGRFLREHLAEVRAPVRYPDLERALLVRCRVAGMSERAARPIVERGTRWVDGALQWRADPRLQLASAFKLNPIHNELLLERLAQHNCLLLLAESGLLPHLREAGELEQLRGIAHTVLPGGHHFHLEDAAGAIAARIGAFWAALPSPAESMSLST
jgi:pimeloyl-ACP methyl ester carboxylesterase